MIFTNPHIIHEHIFVRSIKAADFNSVHFDTHCLISKVLVDLWPDIYTWKSPDREMRGASNEAVQACRVSLFIITISVFHSKAHLLFYRPFVGEAKLNRGKMRIEMTCQLIRGLIMKWPLLAHLKLFSILTWLCMICALTK